MFIAFNRMTFIYHMISLNNIVQLSNGTIYLNHKLFVT